MEVEIYNFNLGTLMIGFSWHEEENALEIFLGIIAIVLRW
jgi:hypothetical protein